MGRFGRYLDGIAGFHCAGCLTLYGKLEAAFQEIGGFDFRVCMPTDRHSSLYCRFHKQRYIARHRTVCLESGRACLLCPDISDFHLLSDGQRVIDLDAEIPDRTFQPRVAKQ